MNALPLRVGSLFSGIGALDLGIERSGLGRIVYQCERDPFCRDILRRHWPNSVIFDDVRDVAQSSPPVDVVCGGFPCQGHSLAGRRKGTNDERWLWPEMFRIFRASGARILIVENVPGLRSSGLRTVLADLAGVGADAYWTTLPAWIFGAPHIRERIYLVAAYTDSGAVGLIAERVARRLAERVQAARKAVARFNVEKDCETSADSYGIRRLEQARDFANERGWSEHCGWRLDRTPDPPAGVDDGSAGVLGLQRKALGNSVVVPVAEFFCKCMAEVLADHAFLR